MSKLLKAIATKHRPAIAAKMTKENGYDEQKHLHTAHLHHAGIINKDERDDLDGCIEDLAGAGDNFAGALKAAMAGELNEGKLNSDAFIKSLMATDSDEGDDDEGDDLMDGDDSVDPADDLEDSDSKVTA